MAVHAYSTYVKTQQSNRGGRVVRRCWVNFQCRGVLRTWITVGQGPIVLALGAGGGCLDIFSLIYHFSSLSSSLWETARYRLKNCLKGPLSPKQPTNQQSNDVKTTSWRRCEVMRSHLRLYVFISTLCAAGKCSSWSIYRFSHEMPWVRLGTESR